MSYPRSPGAHDQETPEMSAADHIPPHLEKDISEIVARITDEGKRDEASESGAIWLVHGPSTAGKTAVLDGVRQRLSGTDVAAIYVAPPLGALDAGPLALTHIALGLVEAGRYDSEDVEPIQDPAVQWDDKIKHVRRLLKD